MKAQNILSLMLTLSFSLEAVAQHTLVSASQLEGRNPEHDAREAIRQGRLNFLGIGGFSLAVPGIDNEKCQVARQFVDIIPGTGDVITDNNGGSIEVTRRYAFRYNLYMKKHAKQKVVFNC